MLRGLFAGLVVLLALSGCSSDSDGGSEKPKVCAPGKTEACACVGAATTGAQTCDDSGDAWGKCICPGDPGSVVAEAECTSGEVETCVCKACTVAIQRTCAGGRWGSCTSDAAACNDFIAANPDVCPPPR